MGFYDDQVLPRITDLALGRPMEETRARVAAGLSGEVLEIGFGRDATFRIFQQASLACSRSSPRPSAANSRRLALPRRPPRSSSSVTMARRYPFRTSRSTMC